MSLGGLYNLVGDLDEVILRVGARTLARLDACAGPPAAKPDAGPVENLVAIALAYCRFAAKTRRSGAPCSNIAWRPEAAFPNGMQRPS